MAAQAGSQLLGTLVVNDSFDCFCIHVISVFGLQR
jgi:hypothetical protein